MKLRALAAFAASVAVYLGAAASMTPPPERPATFTTALDLTGVTRVDLRSSHGMKIVLADDLKARVVADNDGGTKVVLNRNGDRLTVTTHIESYDEIKVFLPPTFRTLVLHGSAEVESRGRREALSVESFGNLSWSGDAGALDLRTNPAGSSTCSRSGDLSVEGRIRTLHAVVVEGSLSLTAPQTMGEIDVLLGPEATIDLEDLRGVPEGLRIADLDQRPIPPVAVMAPGKPAGGSCSAVAADAID